MSFKFKFLGTGTSVGVPQIGCTCPVCTSSDPRDKRRRCGAYVSSMDGGILIDTPPEMREACISEGINRVDAVLLTHAHMDHIAGFDDIRRFNTINGTRVDCSPDYPGAFGRTSRIVGKPLPCFALPDTIVSMRNIFPYISAKGGEKGLYRPQIEFFENTSPFSVCGLNIEAVEVSHGFPCCGYIISDGISRLAYISDCHDIDSCVLNKLKNVDVMILNCLRERDHATHLSLSRALSFISEIQPGITYLTHMCHDLSHIEWLKKLPSGITPAYDGLEISL